MADDIVESGTCKACESPSLGALSVGADFAVHATTKAGDVHTVARTGGVVSASFVEAPLRERLGRLVRTTLTDGARAHVPEEYVGEPRWDALYEWERETCRAAGEAAYKLGVEAGRASLAPALCSPCEGSGSRLVHELKTFAGVVVPTSHGVVCEACGGRGAVLVEASR